MSSVEVDDELAHALYNDFPTFARLCLKIEDKKGKLAPFELNEAQMIIWREIRRQMDAGLPVRIQILKGRQQGASTLCQGISMWLACTREGFRGLTVAHVLKPAAQELFGKVELMYENLPKEVKTPLAPGKATGRRIKLDAPMRSLLVVESAENSDAVGRSGTFSFGHLTEIPFWSNAKETISAFDACVPTEADTFILVESTARGLGNWFADTWMQAKRDKEKGARPAYEPVFVPWYVTDEYKRERNAFDAALTKQEEARMARLGITEEQILWYRDKLQKDPILTPQEYPDTDKDAFLSSGLPYFRAKQMEALHARAKEQVPTAKGSWDVRVEAGRTKIKFQPDATGDLWVYDSPKPGRVYVVSVDPSQGGGRGKDSASYDVLDVTGGVKVRQVASFLGSLTPDELAVQSTITARYYNMALWVPERNNMGELLVSKGATDLAYPNVYRHRNQASIGGKRAVVQGWITSPKTRPFALETLAELVHNDLVEINDFRTTGEMQTFVFANDEMKKAEAAKGAHDDSVMSLAIGSAARNQAGGDLSFEVWD